MRHFIGAACLLWIVCCLTSCGGGPELDLAAKISDEPGMLGGEVKPEAFPQPAAQPGQMQPAAVATTLTLGAPPTLGSVPRHQSNWYSLSLQTGKTYVVTLQPSGKDEDSDLYGLRPQAAQLQACGNSRRGHAGNSLATPDWLAISPAENGLHQVAVVGWSPTTASDPNDFRLEADEVRGVALNGAARAGNLAQRDSQFFRFSATAGHTYTVTLNSTSGDADLFVYGATSDLLQRSATAGETDVAAFTAAAGGWHYLRVYGASAAAFSLTVTGGDLALNNLFFLHHSTGNGFVVDGDMRGHVDTFNGVHGTNYRFWDHGYNGDGLRNAAGDFTGTNYNIPNDNTDPDGLHYLWVSNQADAVAARHQILNRHHTIAFKSCFPASAIPDAATLQNYKNWYLAMRNVFDTRPDHLFVVMSTPPLHRLSTNPTEAANARAFAEWLKSDAYLSGHPNVVCFDLFNLLAEPASAGSNPNCLKYAYEASHADGDSHPNSAGNLAAGTQLAEFMCGRTSLYNASH